MSSIDHFQKLGAGFDIVAEAIAAYDQYMLDDDYDEQSKLTSIIERMRERYALYAGAPSPQIPDGWQPIETAPKDGTPFLAYVPWRDGPCVEVCEFKRSEFYPQHRDYPCVQPTHWMPLPAAPKPPEATK